MAYEQDPGVYLNLIKNAKLVITTSFHGSIFSSLYHKDFWVIKNGGMYGEDDRVITLLDEIGMSSRLIEPNFNSDYNYFKATDYSSFNGNLDTLKKESLKYLKGALDG